MKILHSADWHLDAPIVGRSEQQAAYLRSQLLQIPDKIVSLCKNHSCDLMLLSGDLFDGPYTPQSLHIVQAALAEAGVPVVITPGNHDFCSANSPYLTESWPENVHIFTKPAIESICLEELDCKIYGAGYTAMDCPALLKDFQAEGTQRWHIGVLHSDPLQASSPYAPVTRQQIRSSGLHYLALGHIHKGDQFLAGDTLCAWPGCPMGKGFDEDGIKGALLVTLEDTVSARFLPLDTPRFFDLNADVGTDAAATLTALLPPVQTQDIYRVTLTGYSAPMDTNELCDSFAHVPNLELRNRTQPEADLWANMGDDTLEGVFFKLLHDGIDATDSEKLQHNLKLAAKISRRILDGQEVMLP